MKRQTTTLHIPKHNPALDKWAGVDLFPKKTAKAREILKVAGLPPELRERDE